MRKVRWVAVALVLAATALPAPAADAYVRYGRAWPDRPLTWGFQSYTADLSPAEQEAAVGAAVQAWSRASGLVLTEIVDCARDPLDLDCGTPDIRILFYDPLTHGPVDNNHSEPSKGHTFYPPVADRPGLDGDVHLRDDITWTVDGSPTGNDLQSLALHELGHALGLQHPTQASTGGGTDPGDPGACPGQPSPTRPIMCSLILGIQHDLAPDDVRGIRSLYGAPAHTVDGTVRRSIDRAAVGNDLVNTTGRGQSSTYARARRQKAVFVVRVANDGTEADTVTLRAPTAPAGFAYRYYVGTTGRTPATGVTRGEYEVPLASGAATTLRVEVTVKANAARHRSRALPIRATSQADPTRVDVVRPIVRVT